MGLLMGRGGWMLDANVYSSSPEWHMGVFMLMNVRRRDLVGHPWADTGV